MKKVIVALLVVLAIQSVASMMNACNCGRNKGKKRSIEAVQ